MSYINKIRVLLAAKKYLKNWFLVVISSFRGHPSDLIFRDGYILENVKDTFGVVHLKDKGYLFDPLSKDEILVSKLDLSIICRVSKGHDFSHIYEIFESNTYDLDISNNIVIDVGASNADSSIYFARKGAKMVIGLEPSKESFALGQKNILSNNLTDRVILLNSALSNQLGTSYMVISNQNPNGNSLSPTTSVKKLGIEFDSIEVVKTTSIEALLSDYHLDRIDLLKLDCEGCEYNVLESLSDITFAAISRIVLEYHDGLKFIPNLLFSKGFITEYEKKKSLGIVKGWKG